MSLLTATELRQHLTTSLADTALVRLIDAAEADISARWGALSSQVDEFEDDCPGALIFPSRPVSSMTSIVEKWTDSFIGGTTSTTLAASDYELAGDKKSIRRLASGTHPRTAWGYRVVLTYVPLDESARRTLAVINLCKLEISFNGLDSESVGGGEYRMDAGDYEKKKAQIIERIGAGRRVIA